MLSDPTGRLHSRPVFLHPADPACPLFRFAPPPSAAVAGPTADKCRRCNVPPVPACRQPTAFRHTLFCVFLFSTTIFMDNGTGARYIIAITPEDLP